MKKRFLSTLLAIVMLLSLLPTTVFAASTENCTGECTHEAAIGDTHYDTLAEAAKAVHEKTGDDRMSGTTITLLRSAVGRGVGVGYNTMNENGTTSGNNPVKIIFDLNGNTYTVKDPAVGSSGTETAAFQLLMGSDVTFKNGTVNISLDATDVQRMIQNYADLTLENVTFDATNQVYGQDYALSFNNGNIVFKGDTNIILTNSNAIAFDVCKYSSYPSVNVTFEENFTGKIDGRIMYDSSNAETHTLTIKGNGTFGSIGLERGAAENPAISITGGTFSSDPSAYVPDTHVVLEEDGVYTVEPLGASNATAAIVKTGSDDVYYASIVDALDNASKGDTVKLLRDTTVTLQDTSSEWNGCDQTLWYDTENITLDLNDCTLTTISNYGGSYNVLNVFGTGWTVKNGSIIAKRSNGTADSYALAVEIYEGSFTLDNVALSGGIAVYGTVKATLKDTSMGKTNVAATNYYGVYVEGGAEVKIEGGTYTSNGEKAILYPAASGSYGEEPYDASSIVVVNGDFEGKIFNTDGTGTPGTLKLIGGYFTSDPTAYCAEGYRAGASDKAGYEYKVVEKVAGENAVTEVIPSTGDTTAKAADGVTVDDAFTTAVGGTTATGLAGVAMDEAAGTEISDEKKEEAERVLNSGGSETISYHNQVYLDVTVNGVTTEGDKKKIDLDITAMSQIIASTTDDPTQINLSENSGNAVVVASKPITITTPVTISIPLPAEFVNGAAKVYIQHKSYEYEAVVTAESGKYIATFTNPHGFSEFVITTSSVAVAKIDDVSYLSLQAAVDAVTNGQTINVLTAGQTATVSRTVKFTVTGAACTINLGTNYTDRDESASVFDIVYTEPTTPSTGGGGGGGSTTYSVTAPTSTKNGSVTVSPKSASKGKTVTITVKPDAGYELDKLTVTDKNGDTVTLTKKSDTQYTFTMPASKVEITAVFAEIPQTDPCDDFDDLDPNAWYHDAVNYVLTKGMMSGVSDDEFAPNATLTRAMVVQILWAVEGKPQVNYAMNYGDVSQSDWYAEAVRWAASQGIASGVADGSFAPGASITREQLMTMLYAYAQKKGEGFTGSWMFQLDFADQSQVSSWAYEPACWCTMNGVVSGKDGGRLDPVGTATRAEAAQMLMKFCQTLGE